MASFQNLEFFLLRYLPNAVRGEFVNFGVVILNGEAAEVRFTSNWRRLLCLDPGADTETLAALEADLRAKLQHAGDREAILQIMQTSFSNQIEISASKPLLAASATHEIENLARLYLDPLPRERAGRVATGRAAIFNEMRSSFERAGVWELMRKRVAVAEYTHKGDPLRLDCAYKPNGIVKFFHALSLKSEIDSAKVLAFSYPQIAAGIRRAERAKTELTAIVEDSL